MPINNKLARKTDIAADQNQTDTLHKYWLTPITTQATNKEIAAKQDEADTRNHWTLITIQATNKEIAAKQDEADTYNHWTPITTQAPNKENAEKQDEKLMTKTLTTTNAMNQNH